jgi:ubiquitin-like 1-activating enzyme E1 B
VKSILRVHQERSGDIGALAFNKDDEICIEFVSTAANIRAHNFGIPLESKFKIKEMAGKIIPAISSSNAMVAALQVHEAIKILGGRYEQLHGSVYQRLD